MEKSIMTHEIRCKMLAAIKPFHKSGDIEFWSVLKNIAKQLDADNEYFVIHTELHKKMLDAFYNSSEKYDKEFFDTIKWLGEQASLLLSLPLDNPFNKRTNNDH